MGVYCLGHINTIVVLVIFVGLMALFVISFTLFIRRLLINSSIKSNQSVEIEKKLDKIIELLEKAKGS
ncbi:DUF4083 domain-containing protein [Siminovitchia terrae]|uniref:DUF4083 domain-containing protein n=1 Tax=Siminovitchia terrae TaxID=1914933 RepID=A0A429XE28_SIMTE|nr:DUF4083 domain-containing protein [Siminovitchia terrae]RST61718.1 DUF4083 domain-containing protein [Siminovitchia terrae]